MKNNIKFFTILITFSLLFSGCITAEPSESMPKESLTEPQWDVGTDDTRLLEDFEKASDGKAYFSAS